MVTLPNFPPLPPNAFWQPAFLFGWQNKKQIFRFAQNLFLSKATMLRDKAHLCIKSVVLSVENSILKFQIPKAHAVPLPNSAEYCLSALGCPESKMYEHHITCENARCYAAEVIKVIKKLDLNSAALNIHIFTGWLILMVRVKWFLNHFGSHSNTASARPKYLIVSMRWMAYQNYNTASNLKQNKNKKKQTPRE